jgi:hypothetical protein
VPPILASHGISRRWVAVRITGLQEGDADMRFAPWIFRIAGIYGIVVMAPMLFMERQIAPGATHPVFFYAWVSVNLVWQILFLVLATAPSRYRPMIPICVLQKATAVIVIPWLYVLGRVGGMWLGAAATDLGFAVLFLIAHRMTCGVSLADGA